MGDKEAIGRRGLAKKHAAVDYEVWQWKTGLEKSRSGERRVTKAEVQAFALDCFRKAGITSFKASDGWYRRWRVRWQDFNMGANKDEDMETKFNNSEEKSGSVAISNQDFSKKRKVSDVLSSGSKCKQSDTDEISKGTTCKPASVSVSDSSLKCTVTGLNTISEERINDPNAQKTLGLVTVNGSTSLQLKPSSISGMDSLIVNVNFVKVNQDKSKSIFKVNLPHNKEQPVKNIHVSTIAGATAALDSASSNLISNLSGQDKVEIVSKQCNQADAKVNCNFHTINPSKCCPFKLPRLETLVESKDTDCSCTGDKVKSREEGKVDVDNLSLGSEPSEVSLACDNLICPDGNSEISLLSAGSLEASDSIILSPIFEENHLDFSEHEHELFCDSCEDFHPRQSNMHIGCKQKKEVTNSFLLSCVFEKKELIPVSEQSCLGREITKKIPEKLETSDFQLNNPNVIAPKGKRYLIQFKSKVVNYALNSSVKQAADKFKVNRNTIAEWLAERKRLSTSDPLKCHVNQDHTGDKEFLAWLEDSKFNLTNDLMKQKTQEWLLNSQARSHHCQWLHMYAHRLNGTEDKKVKKRYIAYPEAFKRAVVFHAQTHSNMAAARVFGVARKRTIEWQGLTGDTKKSLEKKLANNVTDEAVDIQVYEWFCQQNPSPSSRQVRSKAVELYRVAGHDGIKCGPQWYYRWRARHKLPTSRHQLYSNATTLLVWTLGQLDNNKCVSQNALAAQATILGHQKVSRGWTFRFCKKYHALLQTMPDPETPLPSELEQQVSVFKHTLHDVIRLQGVSDDCIIALDEVPLHFLPKDRGKKPLLVRRPGFESCQASLMVSCLADGTLLPVLFVFKGSSPDPACVNDPRVLASANETGQVSEDIMEQWVSHICIPCLRPKDRGIVVADSFDAHVTPEVQQKMSSHHVHLAVTPPGCAFRLLPVTPVGHSFKTMLEDLCQMWLSSQTATLESPSPNQLYLWAVRVHKHIAKLHKEKIRIAFNNMLLQNATSSGNNLS